MVVIPELEVMRFEQLAAGDLFLCINGDRSYYGLKTAHSKSSEESVLVTLGPTFADGFAESSILSWLAATTLKIGKNFSILLSSNAAAWRAEAPPDPDTCSSPHLHKNFEFATIRFKPRTNWAWPK